MIRPAALGLFLAALSCGAASRGVAMSPSPDANVFPPVWQVGDSWAAVTRTEVAAPPPMTAPSAEGPPLVERRYTFTVKAVPQQPKERFVVEMKADGDGEVYVLHYRSQDRSLARLARRSAGGAEEVLLENGHVPVIDESNLLPLIDFPCLAPGSHVPGKTEFGAKAGDLTQTLEKVEGGGLRVTIEKRLVMGKVRVVLDWKPNEPWWSSARRFSISPAPDVVAPTLLGEGHLVAGSFRRRAP